MCIKGCVSNHVCLVFAGLYSLLLIQSRYPNGNLHRSRPAGEIWAVTTCSDAVWMDSRLRCYTDAERPNHCRGIAHIPPPQRAHAQHVHRYAHAGHAVMQRWRVVGGSEGSTDTWHTNAALNQPQRLLLEWGVVDHRASGHVCWLISDWFVKTNMQPLKYSRLKAIGSLSWVNLWCVYNCERKKKFPLSRLQRGRTVWLSVDGFSLVFRWIY